MTQADLNSISRGPFSLAGSIDRHLLKPCSLHLNGRPCSVNKAQQYKGQPRDGARSCDDNLRVGLPPGMSKYRFEPDRYC